MNRLVISPHPDDAVWSCGGALAGWLANGDSATVVTVFDGDAPATQVPAATSMAQRRAEDAEALAACGAFRVGLNFVEATMRSAPDGKQLYPHSVAVRRRPHPADADLTGRIAKALKPYAALADVVYAPVGQGTHVDHALARDAVAMVVEPGRLRFYGEFPYRPPAPSGLVASGHAVHFGRWLRDALRYRSQVVAMFGGTLPFARALSQHAERARGARWFEWRAAP
jgi:LmbE family N-acetylglucosaminyl deacetylase